MPSSEDERLRPGSVVETLPSEPAPVTPPVRSRAARIAAIVEGLPLALTAALAVLTTVATVCLMANDYRAALILPIGLPLAALAAWLVWRTVPATSPRTLWPNLAALAVVAGTVGFNLRYGAQDIVVARDQGTYAMTAQWLAHHTTAKIPTQYEVFGQLPGVSEGSLGFQNTNPDLLQSQYPNAAPMLVAMGGWISDAWLLRVAPFIGGAALLSFFALARGIVREWWAVGAMTLLALSMPMIHFSRAVYSEPTAMVFLLGGMALLFVCNERGGWSLHLVAGLAGGATGLARVDGGIFLLAVAGYGVMRLAQTAVGSRRRMGVELAALLVGALVPYLLGMRLTATLSPLYWYGPSGHEAEAYIPGAVALVIALFGSVIVYIAWRGGPLRSRGVGFSGGATVVLAGVLILAAVVGATRPLWFTAHQYIGPTYTGWITFWQKQYHQPVDGTRSYAEYTLTWLSWYDSAIVVAAGVVGIAWLVKRFGRTGRPPLFGFLLVFLSFGLVSLAYPDITADQIWSMRRFLPIVMPGFLIGAAYVGLRLWRYGRNVRLGVGVLCVAALALTVRTSSSLWTVPEGVPQLAEVENVCANLPAHAAVLVGGSSNFVIGYPMTVRSYCKVPVAYLSADDTTPMDTDELSDLRANAIAAGRTLVIVTDDPKVLPQGLIPKPAVAAPISHITFRFWKPVLTHAASDPWPQARRLYLVTVNQDGTVSTPPGQHTLTATG